MQRVTLDLLLVFHAEAYLGTYRVVSSPGAATTGTTGRVLQNERLSLLQSNQYMLLKTEQTRNCRSTFIAERVSYYYCGDVNNCDKKKRLWTFSLEYLIFMSSTGTSG